MYMSLQSLQYWGLIPVGSPKRIILVPPHIKYFERSEIPMENDAIELWGTLHIAATLMSISQL